MRANSSTSSSLAHVPTNASDRASVTAPGLDIGQARPLQSATNNTATRLMHSSVRIRIGAALREGWARRTVPVGRTDVRSAQGVPAAFVTLRKHQSGTTPRAACSSAFHTGAAKKKKKTRRSEDDARNGMGGRERSRGSASEYDDAGR